MNSPVPPPRRDGGNWLGRNWAWFVPAGCLGSLVLFAAFFSGVFLLIVASIRHSWVYGEAVDRARNHPVVIRELGEPIRAGWWILGNLHTSGSSGSADLTIPIAGPRDSARIFAVGEKRAGTWDFEYLVVEIDGSGEVIDLLGMEGDPIRKAGRPGVASPRAGLGRGDGSVLTASCRFAKLDRSDHPGNTPFSDLPRGDS